MVIILKRYPTNITTKKIILKKDLKNIYASRFHLNINKTNLDQLTIQKSTILMALRNKFKSINMKKDKIKINIDGLDVLVEKGSTILQAALDNDIYIPNLCYNSDLKPWGACRLCLVENSEGRLITACENQVEDGMVISTESERVKRVRKLVVQLLIANHEVSCLTCAKNNNCKLQEVAAHMGIDVEDLGTLRRHVPDIHKDESNPFFTRDLKKCVLCGICVRTCDEVGVNAIDFGFRGYNTKITAFADKDIINSNCVSCGECVAACPVGALVPKETLKPSKEVKTTCAYCGVGCGIYLGVRGNEIVSVRGDHSNPVNHGRLCVKGRFGQSFVTSPKRLKKPLIRKNKQDEEFTEVSWEEAIAFVGKKLLKYRHDPEEGDVIPDKNSFAAISSAKCTNEENYVFQKFSRVVMGTNNVDHCARLCHAPSVAGLAKTLGSGAMTNSIGEITDSKCIMAIGTNTTSTHPVIGYKIMKAVQNGAKLIIANPMEIDLCKKATIFLKHHPGTDVPLLMGMMRVIVDEKLYDADFLDKRCEDVNEFMESLEEFDLNSVEKITGVDGTKIVEAARIFAESGASSILYAMGITQHAHGTDNVMAVSNLSLLTGNIGKKSAGVNPLRGQNNVQGSCDMGSLPDVYPGYQKVEDPQVRAKFEEAWNCSLDPSRGMMLHEIMESASKGDTKAIYIMGENPVLSEPDSAHVVESLSNLEFLIVQDIFLTETAKLADVVLPACSFAEKQGTFTSTERRVQLVNQAIAQVGDSKQDWWILSKIAANMGFNGFEFNNASEIMDEIASLTPIYGGISHQRLENGGLQWPCTDGDSEGTSTLHMEIFPMENGRAKIVPLTYKAPLEKPDESYPFILSTGRSLYHYHTSTMTGRVEGLKKLHGHEIVEINSEDALRIGLEDGDRVKVVSRRGDVQAFLRFNPTLQKGMLSMTFHFPETPTNILTNPSVDPSSGTPELKFCAVRIEKCVVTAHHPTPS